MYRRLTRAAGPATRLALALAPALTLGLGCGVEVVGVDRATIVTADARVDVPDASVARADDASPALQQPPDARAEQSTRDAGDDAASLTSWSDPQRPAPVSGQFVDTSRTCPPSEPTAGTRCDRAGQQCDYPVCWGRGQRSYVCIEQRFTVWFDESFFCAATRPCPRATPSAGAVCSLSIECVYPTFCCKGPDGYQSARCDGQWTVAPAECAVCSPTTP